MNLVRGSIGSLHCDAAVNWADGDEFLGHVGFLLLSDRSNFPMTDIFHCP